MSRAVRSSSSSVPIELSNVGPRTNLHVTGTSATPLARASRARSAAAAREPANPDRSALQWSERVAKRRADDLVDITLARPLAGKLDLRDVRRVDVTAKQQNGRRRIAPTRAAIRSEAPPTAERLPGRRANARGRPRGAGAPPEGRARSPGAVAHRLAQRLEVVDPVRHEHRKRAGDDQMVELRRGSARRSTPIRPRRPCLCGPRREPGPRASRSRASRERPKSR